MWPTPPSRWAWRCCSWAPSCTGVQPDEMAREHTVQELAGRLDQYLTALEPSLSRTQAQRLIAEGLVRLNGSAARPGSRLRPGDRLTWEVPAPSPSMLRPEPIDLAVVYEDD